MLPTLISRPPDATADARSTPCFCRKRICAAMPPIAGTARLENDIDSCSSAVRTSGRLIGTVPISATAVAKFVSSEMIDREDQPDEVGAGDRVPQLLRAPDLAEQGEDRDQRADRHHQVRAAHPVELLERWLLGAGGGCGSGAHRRHLLRPLLAVPPVRSQVAAERGRLQVGEGLDDRGVAETVVRGGDGAVVAHERARCSRAARRRRRRGVRWRRRRWRTRSRRCRRCCRRRRRGLR